MDIKSAVARSQMKRFQRSQKSKVHLNTSDPNTTEPAHTEWNNRPAPRPEPTRWNFFGILLFCRSNLSWTPRVSWWRTLNIRIRALYSLIVSSPPHTLHIQIQILIRCTFPTKGTIQAAPSHIPCRTFHHRTPARWPPNSSWDDHHHFGLLCFFCRCPWWQWWCFGLKGSNNLLCILVEERLPI